MASSTTVLSRQNGWSLLSAIARLVGWRFKQMWRFLFVIWLCMLAVVVLVCTLPLFSRVAITADLRSTVLNAPGGSNITVQVDSFYPTTSQVNQIAQQLDTVLKKGSFGPYLQGAPAFVVQTPPLNVVLPGRSMPSAIFLDSYDLAQAAPHATIIQGRLPQARTDGSVEIALTQSVASNLGLQIGSVVTGRYPSSFGSQMWTLHIVGIIAPRTTNDTFWATATNPFGRQIGSSNGVAYSVLASVEAITPKIASLQATSGGGDPLNNSFHLFWSYPFNLSQLDANNVVTFSQQTSDLQDAISNTLTHIQGVSFAFPVGSLYDSLSNYAQQIVVLNIVVTFLLLLILAIVLFLISMLSGMLVERQTEVIAMLRSRGATRQHIAGSFVVQGIVLSLLALLTGPLLAILLVRAMASVLFSPTSQQSLTVITAHPIASALNVKWYALVAVIVALSVMLLAIRRATELDIVTLRRESSRTKHVSFWRRLNLDLLVASLIVVGYVIYVYLWQSLAAAQAFNPLFFNMFNVVGFIAPPLLVAAVLMLFLRFFPLLLRLATYLAAKKLSASSMLAFAQMERAPRPAARMIVLLALAIAASCFLGTLMLTKQERTSEAANFAVGADFSGPLPASDSTKTFNILQAQYSSMQGVLSATVGYYQSIELNSGTEYISAVNADTYAQTALWSSQNSSQPLAILTAQLIAHRSDATTHTVVYALVDAALWQQMHLSQGATFTLPINDSATQFAHFVALAEIHYIPGVYDTPIDPTNGVGVLVDYQSFATVYAKVSGTTLMPDAVLLRTKDDAASLASIRKALPGLSDRRQMIADNQTNTIHLDILGELAIGVAAALLLALVGTLLSSWLNATNRRTNFAVMRALGMAPRQLASILLWEQGFIYTLSLLLGIGLGALLTIFAAPAVSLLDLAAPSAQNNPYDVPPVQTMIPYAQLVLMLGSIVIICLVSLLLMTAIVTRPSISQTLRLNED